MGGVWFCRASRKVCEIAVRPLPASSKNRIGRRVGRRSNFFGTSKEGTREETTSEQQKSRQNAQADVVGGCRADKSWAQNMTW